MCYVTFYCNFIFIVFCAIISIYYPGQSEDTDKFRHWRQFPVHIDFQWRGSTETDILIPRGHIHQEGHFPPSLVTSQAHNSSLVHGDIPRFTRRDQAFNQLLPLDKGHDT